MKGEYTFHEGEIQIQRRVGDEATAARNGGMISRTISAGALPFLAKQPMVVFGSRDGSGSLWASPLFGEPGFVQATSDRRVEIALADAVAMPNDPLWDNITSDSSVGMLAIELSTRRRLRINGQLRRIENTATMDVEWAYPNCPKYIQRRTFAGTSQAEAAHAQQPATSGQELTESGCHLIRAADTFFVASGHPRHGVDCSHRGGAPGFVQVLDRRQLRIPDYVGNSMYNTLGNFAVHPRAGIAFIDFNGGSVLSLTGNVTLEWDASGSEELTTGTCRFWRFNVEAWRHAGLTLRPRWEYVDASPFNPAVLVPSQASTCLGQGVP